MHKSHIVQIGDSWVFGGLFIVNNRLVEVRTKYFAQLAKWIRENKSNIFRFDGSCLNIDADWNFSEMMDEYFKVHALCFYNGIFGDYSKRTIYYLKHPAAK